MGFNNNSNRPTVSRYVTKNRGTVKNRKKIRAEVSRQLFEEAGFRCAVPNCRETSELDRAHIVPHSKTQDNSFENLIILCTGCHRKYDNKKIPRTAILNYKKNLAVLNGRYNDFERRLLEDFHARGTAETIELEHAETTKLMLRNLVRDGIVRVEQGRLHEVRYANGGTARVLNTTFTSPYVTRREPSPIVGRNGGTDLYTLTDAGQVLVARWFGAVPII